MDLPGPSNVVPSASKEQSKPSTAKSVSSNVANIELQAFKTYQGPKNKAQPATTLDASYSLPGPSNIVPIKPKTTPRMSKDVWRPSLDSSDYVKSPHSTTPASAVLKDLQNISNVFPDSSFVVLPDSSIIPSTQETAASDHAKSPRNTTNPVSDLKDFENISAPETSTSCIAVSSSSATIQPSFAEPSKSLPDTSKAAALKSDRSPSDDEHFQTKAVLEPVKVKSTLTVSLPLVNYDAMKTARRMSKEVQCPSLDSSDNAKSLHSTTPASSVPKDLENISNASPDSSFVVVPGTSESTRSTFKNKIIPAMDLAGPSMVVPCRAKNESKPATTKTIISSGAGISSNTAGTNQSDSSKTGRSRKKKSRRRRSPVAGDTSIVLSGPSNIPSTQDTAASNHAKCPRNTTKPVSDLKDLENISNASPGSSFAVFGTSESNTFKDKRKTAIGQASPLSTLKDNHKPAMDQAGPSSSLKDKHKPVIDQAGTSSTLKEKLKSAMDQPGSSSSWKNKLKPAMDQAGPSKASPCTSENESKLTWTKTVTLSGAGSSSNTPGANQSEASKTDRRRKKKSRRRRSPVPVDTLIALPDHSNIPSTPETTASDHARSPQNTTKPASDLKDLENISAPETSTSSIAGSSSSATEQPSFADPSKSLPGTSIAAALKCDRSPSDDEHCPIKAVLEPSKVKSSLTVSLPLVRYDRTKTARRPSKDDGLPSLDSSDNAKSVHSTTPTSSVPKDLENISNVSPDSSFVIPLTLESSTLKDKRKPSIDLTGPSKVVPCMPNNEFKHTTTKTITSSGAGTSSNAPLTETSKTGRSRKKKSRRRRSPVPGDTSIALIGPSRIPST